MLTSWKFSPSRSAPDPWVTGLSPQDPFPKGVIPLTAIEMTRSSKDNKFQVITGQRVFVFRTESEGEGRSPLGYRGKEAGLAQAPLTCFPAPSPAPTSST